MSAQGERQFLLSTTRRWVSFVLGGVLLFAAAGTLAGAVASFGLHPITGHLIAVASLIAVLLPTAVLPRPISWRPLRILLLVVVLPVNLVVLSGVIFFLVTRSRLGADEAGLLELANVLLLIAAPAAAMGGAPRPTDRPPGFSPGEPSWR